MDYDLNLITQKTSFTYLVGKKAKRKKGETNHLKLKTRNFS